MVDYQSWYRKRNNFARMITNQYYLSRIKFLFLQGDDPSTDRLTKLLDGFDKISEEGRFSNAIEIVAAILGP